MTIKQIDEDKATWAANQFIDYFQNFTNLEEYLRHVKKSVVTKSSILDDPKDDFFNRDIHPNDMEFDIRLVGDRFQNGIPQDYYRNLLSSVSSHNNEDNIPGRELRLMVYEKNTNKIVGFIRLQSPLINSKPRNQWLGKAPDLTIFNRHAVMGFAIVPSQPFGYNYLGGKLLALICVSHFIREKLNNIFEKDIALFETTSLYGSSSSASQYDGLKPFMRFKGLTDSKLFLFYTKRHFIIYTISLRSGIIMNHLQRIVHHLRS